MKKTKSKKVQKQSKKPASKDNVMVMSRDGGKGGKILPLGSRVLIKPFTKEELEKKNSFGIILPGTNSDEKSEQGIVVAVGPGEYREGKLVSVALNVGEKVAFSKYGFEEIQLDGEEFYLIKEENILAVLK